MSDIKVPDFDLYMATGSKQYLEFLLTCNVKNILISFAYPQPWKMINIIKRNNVKLLCDSGAFTSWNLAQKAKTNGDLKWNRHLIDIDKYLHHLNKYKEHIFRAVNLDVIPGEQGKKPQESQILEAAEQGWQNYQYLKSKGWDTIHVFHEGEPLWVLNRMLDECDYIGISPCNDSSDEGKYKWMDEIFRYLIEYDYSKNPHIAKREIIKTHGFAVTAPNLIERFPWHSVDSSTYSITAAMGTILTPYGRIYISDQGLDTPNHINNKPEMVRDHIEKYLYDTIGYGINTMTDTREEKIHICPKCSNEINLHNNIRAYKPRNFANIIYFMDIEKERREKGPTLDFMKQSKLNL